MTRMPMRKIRYQLLRRATRMEPFLFPASEGGVMGVVMGRSRDFSLCGPREFEAPEPGRLPFSLTLRRLWVLMVLRVLSRDELRE